MNTIQRNMKHVITVLIPLILAGFLFAGLSGCGGDEAGQEQAESGQLWTCGMHPNVIQEEPGNCPICGMKLTPLKSSTAEGSSEHSEEDHSGMDMGEQQSGGEKKDKKILYWRAPMDPTYISDKPGKSPMGMDLIPVYEG
ncbi:MAG TPA: efflux RND transporter periplasmic adaptor subunit, partial [Bacteroidetes bacterium]|nr:efflux RND transporter periplasmic adaptor subunit [Bacteroidota bacterium]